MKKLFIMRGLPGSGKSTAVNALMHHFSAYTKKYCSADFFHYYGNCKDEYRYNHAVSGFAHKWCQSECAHAMQNEVEIIFIDNTNVSFADIAPYLEMAAQWGYEVEICEAQTSWAKDVEECAKRNLHKVPAEVIQKMAERWQEIKIRATP